MQQRRVEVRGRWLAIHAGRPTHALHTCLSVPTQAEWSCALIKRHVPERCSRGVALRRYLACYRPLGDDASLELYTSNLP